MTWIKRFRRGRRARFQAVGPHSPSPRRRRPSARALTGSLADLTFLGPGSDPARFVRVFAIGSIGDASRVGNGRAVPVDTSLC